MFNRRLLILFLLFLVGTGIYLARLFQLQVTNTEQWKAESRSVSHRHNIIETARGTIFDRNNEPLARDEPCFDLAIDYRAMNLDDRWITRTARARLRGEQIPDRKDYLARLALEKANVADLVDAIPDAIRQHCGIPIDLVHARFNEIRARIRVLHQDRWGRKYDAEGDKQNGPIFAEADLNKELRDENISHTLVSNIPDSVAFYFMQNKEQYPGLRVIDSRRRAYPYNDVACHLIGAMRAVDKPAVDANPFDMPDLLASNDPGRLGGYLPGDRTGESGIERFAEDSLRGFRGARLMQLGADDPERHLDPVRGKDVRLTLDVKLQRDIQASLLDPTRNLLKGADGQDHLVALVVLSMQGEVLVMISLPTYDLNHFEELLPKLIAAPKENSYLVNRAIAAAYPPGSTIKPLIATAGLSEGVITPNDTITCNGFLFPGKPTQFRCDIYLEHNATHGPLQLATALEKSCNIYFYTVGSRLGLERELRWLDLFGFNHNTGVELYESDGITPDPKDLADPELAKTESILLGIGQGRVTATPLQMANAYATLLRGGENIKPHVLADAPLERSRRVTISPSIVATLRDGMVRVVKSGTGKTAFAGLKEPLGGKTGSATTGRMITVNGEQVRGDSDAWFVGYAPADNPQYVIAAVKEFGGHGGVAAAPLVKETVLQMEKHGYLPKLDFPNEK